jgi:hypothetical protein
MQNNNYQNENKTWVRMLTSYDSYNTGEICYLENELATSFVTEGVATYFHSVDFSRRENFGNKFFNKMIKIRYED